MSINYGLLKKHPREAGTWRSMRRRCRNPANISYKHYGAKGIAVCDRWESFAAFMADMGPSPGPGFSIDRLDNSKGYEPQNCKWSDKRTQTRNRSNTLMVEYQGKQRPFAELAEQFGVPYATALRRLKFYGLPLEEAIKPNRKRRGNRNCKGRKPKDRNAAMSLIASGSDVDEVAMKTGFAKTTVRRIIKEMGESK